MPLVFQMSHIIFGTDSRGRGLEQYIHQNNALTTHTLHCIIIPGGTLSTIIQQVQNKIQSLTQQHNHTTIHCTIAAGICNLTKKTFHQGGMEISYLRDANNIASIKQTISSTYQTMHSNNIHFNLVHIPPASISKYSEFNIQHGKLKQSSFTTTDFHEQQTTLEQDIQDINNHISTQNQIYSTLSIRWDRDILKCKKRKRGRNNNNTKISQCFSYSDLYDGVHANSQLKNKWFYFLVKSTDKSVFKSDTDSEEEEENTWDFKRSKLTS